MLERREYTHFSWIHLSDPRPDEVRAVAEEFSIHPGIAQELLAPSAKPHAEMYGQHMYLVLHFPALRRAHIHEDQEIDFVIGKNVVVTAHYEHIDTLHKFEKTLALEAVQHATYEHSFDMFIAVLKRLYRSVEHEAEAVRDVLENIERDMFLGEEREMVFVLSKVARDILNLRQSIEPHQEILRSAAAEIHVLAPEEYVARMRNIENLWHRVFRHIQRLEQTLRELRETNNSLLNTKQNEIMKVLTVMAFVTFPLSLIAAVFGMNTTHTPLVEQPHGFWIIVVIMLVIAGIMFAYFRKKGWL
jgi:magnesium transporter